MSDLSAGLLGPARVLPSVFSTTVGFPWSFALFGEGRIGTGGAGLWGCVTADPEPGLCGTSGAVLLGEPLLFGEGATFCVSIEGSEFFLSGGGGIGFSYLLHRRSDCKLG